MYVEFAESVKQTARDLTLPYSAVTTQSNETVPINIMLTGVHESLVASLDAIELQRKLIKLSRDLHWQWHETVWPAMLDNSQFASSFNVIPSFGQQGIQDSLLAHDVQMRILNSVRMAFEDEPLEDGMDHYAEEIIRLAIIDVGEFWVLNWLGKFALDPRHPNLAASVLRCLGRLVSPGTELWRTDLIRKALEQDEVEIETLEYR